MSGADFELAVARYISGRFSDRGVKVFRKVIVGTSIVGKKREMDILVVPESGETAFAVECKFQGTKGSTDEKVYFALEDLKSLNIPGRLVYGGAGWSEGILSALKASNLAVHHSLVQSGKSARPRELDLALAIHFGWWDVLTRGKRPVSV